MKTSMDTEPMKPGDDDDNYYDDNYNDDNDVPSTAKFAD